MPGNAPYFYLSADERVLLRVRAQPSYALALALPLAIGPTVLLALALVGRALFEPMRVVPPWAIWTAWGALVALAALVAWRRAATSEYALTDQRIYARVGRLVTSLHFTTHDKVTDIHYRQGPLERVLGIGTLTFATAGGDVRAAGIREPMALKEAAEAARDAFVRALLQEARVEPAEAAPAASAAEPRPAPAPALVAPPWSGPRPSYLQGGDTPVWYAKPTPIAAVSSLRSLVGVFVVLLFSNFMEGPRRVWLPVAAVALVAVFIGVRLMQLRRTEYTATDRRVYARRGLVGTTVAQLTYDKITDITYTQDLLGRLLGYGSVSVNTAGSSAAPIVMVGLRDPLAAKETIERWRDASLGGSR